MSADLEKKRLHNAVRLAAYNAESALARLLAKIRLGDTMVVVRPDRLARSLSHLLQVIETLEARARISGRLAILLTPPRLKQVRPAGDGRGG